MHDQAIQLVNLAKKREKWVEANRENGFEKGITNLLTELYPDNAHFIYELLQNAEDTHADIARFTLSDGDVRFEHDGKRLFDFKDVESITSIGASTKRNDPTNIGKFGVGFKAVFAYTNTPEIHSGNFHFRIKQLVVPETLPNTTHAGVTVFHFPFDDAKKTPAKAVEEIERGLRALSDSTLLFLNRIREIEYMLPNGELGALRRVDTDSESNGQRLEIHAEQAGEAKTITNWLRYRKEISITDDDGKNEDTSGCYCLSPRTHHSRSRVSAGRRKEEWQTNSETNGRMAHCALRAWTGFHLLPSRKGNVQITFPHACTVRLDGCPR